MLAADQLFAEIEPGRIRASISEDIKNCFYTVSKLFSSFTFFITGFYTWVMAANTQGVPSNSASSQYEYWFCVAHKSINVVRKLKDFIIHYTDRTAYNSSNLVYNKNIVYAKLKRIDNVNWSEWAITYIYSHNDKYITYIEKNSPVKYFTMHHRYQSAI